jgi:CBS domain containing-hemolysin-like protein
MFWITTFLVIFILIAFNALYVLSEFSTVSSRRSRLAHLADEGSQFADTILKIVEDPKKLDGYVATCQVGITISSLVLGFYGQAQLTSIISPVFSGLGNISSATATSISATLILIVLSIFQILLGELIPKNIGIQFPERMAVLTTIPMRWSAIIFKPLIWLFNGSGNLIRGIFKLDLSSEHSHIHSPEEIAMLIDESGEGGLLKTEEHRLLANTLKMREATVRQVMIPRARMLMAPTSMTRKELLSLVADSPYSRIPIYEGDIDKIQGVIHLRDLLCYGDDEESWSVTNTLKAAPFIPESMQVKEALNFLQLKRFQVAIVLDEFGGTAGMVTLEDLLEQIFGDLKDEFDTEAAKFQILPNDQIWIHGNMLIEHVNQLLDINLPQEDIDTIGGLILHEIGYVPIANDEVIIEGHRFRVEKMSGRGVAIASYKADSKLIKVIKEKYP